MSTYWGLHCKTCDTSTNCGLYASEPLADVAGMAPLVKQIREGDTQGYIEMRLMGWENEHDLYLFDWLVEHGSHDLELCDEYGRRKAIEHGNKNAKVGS